MFARTFEADAKKLRRISTTNCRGYVMEKIAENSVFPIMMPSSKNVTAFSAEKTKNVNDMLKYLFIKSSKK